MTDRIALVLGLVIVAAIAADVLLNSAGVSLFIGRKFADAIEELAFWR